MNERQLNRAAPFIAAAVSGLTAHPRVHKPELVAEVAVDIGLAVAARLEKLAEDAEEPKQAAKRAKG